MNSFNLSIKARILWGFALPIALFLAFTLWLGTQLTQVKQSMNKVSEQSVQYALLATSMDKDVVQIQQYLSVISATRGKDGLEDGFIKAQENFDSLNVSLDKFEKHFTEVGDPVSVKRVQDVRASVLAFYSAGQYVAMAYVSEGPAAGNKLMAGFDRASQALQKSMEPFVKTQVNQMHADVLASGVKADQIAQTAFAIIGVALAIAVFTAYYVTTSITRPLTKALGVANLVASGQLDTKIESDNSEIGQLLSPLAKMQATLQAFETAQTQMVREHDAGNIDSLMPVTGPWVSRLTDWFSPT